MEKNLNCKVILKEYMSSERYFTLGKVYKMVDGTLTNDNGFRYVPQTNGTPVLEWLKGWYIFEVVDDATDIICDKCGCVIEDDNYIMFDGQILCDDCKDEYLEHCEDCGNLIWKEDAVYIEDCDRVICQDCCDDNYVTCEDCGALVHIDDAYHTAYGYNVCDYCRDNYTYCANCDELYHDDDIIYDEENDEYYCSDCYNEELAPKTIHNYSYKPTPIFYNCENDTDTFYMGIELEIDKGGEDRDNALELLNIANCENEHIYIKHDGSIYNGFEIVSHPATLEYHTKNILWQKTMEKALSMNYRSHDTDTCGLHIHISRKAFGIDNDTQENNISKILYFVEKNWDKVLPFTRRNEANLNRWASRYGIESTAQDTYKKAKGDYNRYRCINLQNNNTIEFRVFRGTLKYTTFVATLEFVKTLCEFCIKNDTESVLTWDNYTASIDTNNNYDLFNYLTEKNLWNYIDLPIED